MGRNARQQSFFDTFCQWLGTAPGFKNLGEALTGCAPILGQDRLSQTGWRSTQIRFSQTGWIPRDRATILQITGMNTESNSAVATKVTANNNDFTIRRARNDAWNMVSLPPIAVLAEVYSAVVNCRITGRGRRDTPVAGVRGSVHTHLRNTMTTNKCSDNFAQMKSSFRISSSLKSVL